MNTELFSFLSEGGLADPHFYILIKNAQFAKFAEVEWKNILGESESYMAQVKSWWNSSTIDLKRDFYRGEIIATSKSLDPNNNACILIDSFIEKKRKAFPFIQVLISELKLKEINCREELAALLTISDLGERFVLYNDNFHILQQFIYLNSDYKVRICDVASKQEYVGIIRKARFIDFQLYYFLQPDTCELADEIQFGISSFRELIMDKPANNNSVENSQKELYNKFSSGHHPKQLLTKGSSPNSHNNPVTHQDYQHNQGPTFATANPTFQPQTMSTHSHINPNQYPQQSSKWTQISPAPYNPPPLQSSEVGVDAVPLNEGPPEPLPSYGLAEGCSVKVKLKEKFHFGRVVWVGTFKTIPGAYWTLIETTELRDEPNLDESNGIKYHTKIGNVKAGHGLFVPAKSCIILSPDEIRCDQLPQSSLTGAPNRFDKVQAYVIDNGFVPPIKDVKDIIGIKKGIQGLDNSCYMDASLFGMFCFNERLDDIFLKKSDEGRDINPSTERYLVVQKILKERIVYPLRREGFVRADQILLLRYKLDEAGVVDGLLGKEKDPEEFLTCLLQHVLSVQPYLKIRGARNEDGFFFQIFTHRRPYIHLPTVQLLLEHAFREDRLMLAEVPQFFLIQMPRDGKHFRLYPHIVPSLTLDISSITQSVYAPKCILCARPALYRCESCETEELYDYRKPYVYYCQDCVEAHSSQTKHAPAKLECETKQLGPPSQLTLFAVLTIEIGHYVCFAKCGKNPRDWVMFDSMHDRIEDGDSSRNVPRVIPVPDLEDWLSDPNKLCKVSDIDARKTVPEYVRRLTRDVYICMYYSEASEMF